MAMPAAIQPPPSLIGGRSFALLDGIERQEVAGVLRPLPWIDGFLTALVIVGKEATYRGDCVYDESAPDDLPPDRKWEAASIVEDHLLALIETLHRDVGAYRPYLGDAGDRLEAASQWASGFCFGVSLELKAWQPVIASEDARALVVMIFSLEQSDDVHHHPDSPFRKLSKDRLEHVRRTVLEELPDLVPALHDFARTLGGAKAEPVQEPYVRWVRKVGRNDPCPCGSGRKYKACCLG
jgi:uncharacterized protein